MLLVSTSQSTNYLCREFSIVTGISWAITIATITSLNIFVNLFTVNTQKSMTFVPEQFVGLRYIINNRSIYKFKSLFAVKASVGREPTKRMMLETHMMQLGWTFIHNRPYL